MKRVIADAALIGAVLMADKLLRPKEEKEKMPLDMHDPDLQRRLTWLSVVYHAIGIIYNE